MNKKARSIIYPLIAAFLWGTTFTAQSMLAEHMTPFFINCYRSIIAAIVLFVICLFVKKKRSLGAWKDIILSSLFCGITLFFAANFQQLALSTADSGKTAFVTSLYTVIVPVFGLFFGRRVSFRVWIAIAVFLAGMFLMCGGTAVFNGSLGMEDLYLVLCAIFYAGQIMMISLYTKKVDGFAISCGQFIVVAILSGIAGFIFESPSAQDVGSCILPLLYAAIFSSCVAYTLQILSLRDGEATITSLIYSLESVFGLIAGVVVLGERPSMMQLLGCALMFMAVLYSQIRSTKRKVVKEQAKN